MTLFQTFWHVPAPAAIYQSQVSHKPALQRLGYGYIFTYLAVFWTGHRKVNWLYFRYKHFLTRFGYCFRLCQKQTNSSSRVVRNWCRWNLVVMDSRSVIPSAGRQLRLKSTFQSIAKLSFHCTFKETKFRFSNRKFKCCQKIIAFKLRAQGYTRA